KEFEESHDGVKIDLVEVPWDDAPEKMATAIAGSSLPDVVSDDVSGHVLTPKQYENGVVEPLNDVFTDEELADFKDSALDAYTYKDKLYGVPAYMTIHTMLLNLDLF